MSNVEAPTFENVADLRSAALSAMGGSDDAPSTATDTQDAAAPVEQPATAGKARGADGKFLPTKSDHAEKPADEEQKPETDAKTEAKKEPTRAEARRDLIALRNQQAALARQTEKLEREAAAIEARRAEVEARAQRHASAKQNPVQYLRELARETGYSFEQLYQAATQEMLGHKEPELSPQEKAIQAKLTELEEQTKRAQYELARRDSIAQFREWTAANAERFPLFAKEPAEERQAATDKFANDYHRKHGTWPEFEKAAAHFEPLLKAHYEQQAEHERREYERLAAKFSQATPGASDRGNGAAQAGNPRDRETESPRTLSNGHATQKSGKVGDKPMTPEQLRRAALEVLSKAS